MTDDVTVAADGVSVTKSYESERFPVPAIAFEIDSDRDERVALRLTDDVPESFPVDRIGFHPDYESENWTAFQDHRVQYERTLDPGEAVTTVYGIRLEADEDPAAFLGDPEVAVTPLDEVDEDATEDRGDEAAVEDIVPSETTDVVREALADDEPVPGLDLDGDEEPTVGPDGTDDSGVGAAADDSPTEAAADVDADGDVGVAAVEQEAAETGESDADAASPPADGPGLGLDATEDDERTVPDAGTVADDRPVAEALAAEIRAGDVADDDLDALRDALAADADEPEGRRNVGVRLEHLQGRVSDLEAYADALEAFIDGEGTARDVLEDVRADLEAVESRTDALERDVETLDREMEQLRGEFADAADGLDAVDDLVTDVERLEGDLDALDERVADVEAADGRVADLRDDVSAIEDDIAEIREWRDQLTDVFGG